MMRPPRSPICLENVPACLRQRGQASPRLPWTRTMAEMLERPMNLRGRMARLERWAEAAGLHECPGCQRRRGEIPGTTTRVLAGEHLPEPDHCPVCGVEWPAMTLKIVGANPGQVSHIVYSPVHYDPVYPAQHPGV